MNKILKILFKYKTDNTEADPNPNILPCINEISDYLKSRGVFTKIQEYEVVSSTGVKVRHANLLAYNPRSKNDHILFQGHIDTIPSGFQYEYKITKKDLVGRGAVDMKGSLAGMITAFLNVYGRFSKSKHPPALLITADEEANGFAGIKHFLKTVPINVEVAVNGEPTNFSVSRKFKGVSMYKIEMHGQIGHSSSIDNDRLIEGGISVLVRVRKFLNESRKIKNKKFGETIAALTVCNAGVKSNQLPELIKIGFNLRTVDNRKIYERVFDNSVRKHLKRNTVVKLTHFDPVETKISEKALSKMMSAFKKSGLDWKESTFNAFSEASIMISQGMSVVACGPGDISLAHVKPTDEKLSIENIKAYSRLLKNIVEEFNS